MSQKMRRNHWSLKTKKTCASRICWDGLKTPVGGVQPGRTGEQMNGAEPSILLTP